MQSGADTERASLGHDSHICPLELNINVWSSRAAEVIQRHTWKFFAAQLKAPTPLLTAGGLMYKTVLRIHTRCLHMHK